DTMDKYKMHPIIENLHILRTELREHIDQLKNEITLGGQSESSDKANIPFHVGCSPDEFEHVLGSENFGR
ncbi:MAG: hypothetical protein ABUJ92_07455, partial [Desulfobacterales bacterium]